MGRRILIIDDDELFRRLFVKILEDTGYEIETASSGEEGLIRFQKARPDLVFLDFHMPGMNGADTLLEIRKLDLKVPVYIVTSLVDSFLKHLNAAAKKDIQFEILSKPVESQQVQMLVRAALDGPSEY